MENVCVLEMWMKVLESLAEITGPWEANALFEPSFLQQH